MVQILDAPVPQMVEQLPDVVHFFDTLTPDPEQVIEVPKILLEYVPVRTAVVTQLAEQLVEVPTTISFSSLQRIVEQNVAIPVPGGGGRLAGLQGVLPGQSSTAPQFSEERISERFVKQIVDIPGGRLQSFRPGQSSSASSSSPAGVHENTDEPRERVFFALSPDLEKVRRSPASRVQGRMGTRAHPSSVLIKSLMAVAPGTRTRTSSKTISACGCVCPLADGCCSAQTRPSTGTSWVEGFSVSDMVRLLLPGCVEASSAAAWKAESGPSSRQSTDVFSFPWFLLALSALGNMAHFSSTTLYLAIYSSVPGCCLWNTVLDSSEDDFVCGRNAWLDSGYIFCISIWLLTNPAHFLRRSGLELTCSVSVLLQKGEVCSADASVFGPRRDARTLKTGHCFYELHVAETSDDGQHFSPLRAAFFGLLFGVEARVSGCQLISTISGHTHVVSEHAS